LTYALRSQNIVEQAIAGALGIMVRRDDIFGQGARESKFQSHAVSRISVQVGEQNDIRFSDFFEVVVCQPL
jgi:hypothetical protein